MTLRKTAVTEKVRKEIEATKALADEQFFEICAMIKKPNSKMTCKSEHDLATTIEAALSTIDKTMDQMLMAAQMRDGKSLMVAWAFSSGVRLIVDAGCLLLKSSPAWDDEQLLKDQWNSAVSVVIKNAKKPSDRVEAITVEEKQ